MWTDADLPETSDHWIRKPKFPRKHLAKLVTNNRPLSGIPIALKNAKEIIGTTDGIYILNSYIRERTRRTQ